MFALFGSAVGGLVQHGCLPAETITTNRPETRLFAVWAHATSRCAVMKSTSKLAFELTRMPTLWLSTSGTRSN